MKPLRWAFVLFLLIPGLCFAQVAKKIPVSVSHEGDDQIGRSVNHALEELIRTSQRFSLVAENAKTPRIIILMQSVDTLVAPQQGRVSATAYSIIYYRTKIPGAGVLLGIAVNSCSPGIIESCAKGIIPHLEGAVDFLRSHDPDLWETL